LTQSNQQKGWLTAEEEESIINFAIEVAQQGFPLNPQRLKDRCKAILQHGLCDFTTQVSESEGVDEDDGQLTRMSDDSDRCLS
jgi:hypothetical protein